MSAPEPALLARAAELGIDTTYVDVHRERHDAHPAALAVVVEMLDADAAAGGPPVFEPVVIAGRGAPTMSDGHVLGAASHRVTDTELELADGTIVTVRVLADGHTLSVPDALPLGCHTLRVETFAGSATSTVVCPPPSMLTRGSWHGGSGLFVPTYALWDHDRPLPSFSLLARLARALVDLDTEVVTTLPLYANFLDDPFDPSPYAPASRLHWNEVFVDDEALPPAPVPAQGRYLDWAALARRRRGQLLAAVDTLDQQTSAELDRFVTDRPDVAAFARFLTDRSGATGGGSVGGSVDGSVDRARRSHELAQYLADRQLAELADADRSGRGAVLAIDLPIGCHVEGYERWAHPELFADGYTIGAPPDLFFTEGQNWGLPPQLPVAGRRSGHRLWRDLLARAGEHAALLRIDHVMAVHRLWWVPEGFGAHQGVYVRYPSHELLAVIAATAAECGTVVVGEELGTVPQEVGELLAEWEMLGMHEEQFHMTPPMMPDAGLADIPARSVTGIRTHDMQPFAAFVAEQGDQLAEYRRRVGAELGREVGASYCEVLDAVLELLARSPSALVTIDLDDLTGETEHHNVPGKVLDSSWGRRLDRPLSELLDHPDIRRRLHLLGNRPRD
ncbi:4-alpha-glucanotransferase [soil metagenome]